MHSAFECKVFGQTVAENTNRFNPRFSTSSCRKIRENLCKIYVLSGMVSIISIESYFCAMSMFLLMPMWLLLLLLLRLLKIRWFMKFDCYNLLQKSICICLSFKYIGYSKYFFKSHRTLFQHVKTFFNQLKTKIQLATMFHGPALLLCLFQR